MKTFDAKNCKKGIKVSSKFKAIMLKEIWNRFSINDRNFINSLKNYYDVNGFLSNKQYNCIAKLYDKHIDNYTEFQEVN